MTLESDKLKSTSQTFDELLKLWIEAAQIRESTAAGYRSKIALYISPALGKVPLNQLTGRHLDALYGDLKERGLAPATIKQTHIIIHKSLGQALKWGWIEKNPALLASPPGLTSHEMISPTPEQVRTIVADALESSPAIARIIALASLTGLRRGELLGLKWSDLDGEKIHVRHSLAYTPRAGVHLTSTKTGKVRTVIVGKSALDIVASQQSELIEGCERSGFERCQDPYLFYGDVVGEVPVHPDTPSKAFRRIADQNGWRDLHFHSLRHFAATTLIGAGVDIRTVSGRLGHANAYTTLKIYAHAVPEKDREAADILGAALALPH